MSARFVAAAVFRSLLGTWELEREIKSQSPHQPSGRFRGTAKFFLRDGTADGPAAQEYLYVEEGTFLAEDGLRFAAMRRYVWRYDEERDVLGVWFIRPDDDRTVDRLFHELEFTAPPADGADRGWEARAGHLCEEDYYGVKYEFRFRAVNLTRWSVEYSVKGPRKDYTLSGQYRR